MIRGENLFNCNLVKIHHQLSCVSETHKKRAIFSGLKFTISSAGLVSEYQACCIAWVLTHDMKERGRQMSCPAVRCIQALILMLYYCIEKQTRSSLRVALTANFMQISVSMDMSEIGRVCNYAGFGLPKTLDRGAAMHNFITCFNYS